MNGGSRTFWRAQPLPPTRGERGEVSGQSRAGPGIIKGECHGQIILPRLLGLLQAAPYVPMDCCPSGGLTLFRRGMRSFELPLASGAQGFLYRTGRWGLCRPVWSANRHPHCHLSELERQRGLFKMRCFTFFLPAGFSGRGFSSRYFFFFHFRGPGACLPVGFESSEWLPRSRTEVSGGARTKESAFHRFCAIDSPRSCRHPIWCVFQEPGEDAHGALDQIPLCVSMGVVMGNGSPS